ncbi:MAG: hypothetical protein NZV14_01025 [Bryobacteraceae bacterium]|nr:hypothetical protein [Bryobacteraceae bacterium]MDW8376712.1 hypothetical protein [Bryobacterales bacterium]
MRKRLQKLLPDSEDLVLIAIFTRHWIHYGVLAFVTFLTLAAAVKGLFLS